jgi:putative sterol carrier protein
MATTPAEFFAKRNEQLRADGGKLASINSTYQFSLSGDNGGDWVIELTEACQEVRDGSDDSAACTIAMTADDFMGLIGGTLNAPMAFMTGKFQVKGDLGLAMKHLQNVLSTPRWRS